ncbi:class I SAM-dependent methyltransferase [Lachnospiraceae bacterium 62-35]
MYKEYGWKEKHVSSTEYIYRQIESRIVTGCKKCILDLGCGNGEIANLLIFEGFDVYGVDASAQGIAIAEKQNPGHFFIMNFESDELPDELKKKKFDAIISTEVIEHLYSPVKYCKLAFSLLEPGGMIIITTPYHGYFKNLLISLFGKWDKHFTPLWEGGHIKFWSHSTLKTLLENNGFSVTGMSGCGRIPYLWKSMVVTAVKEKKGKS